jgi:hypothetical protein
MLAAMGLATAALPANAQSHPPEAGSTMALPVDTRQLVKLPERMRLHTIASMRDHLLALQQIVEALSGNAFENAAAVAEKRLGMSSLDQHGAQHIAPFMPQGMRDLGTGMHREASRFAIEAQNAAAGGDSRPALAALAAVMQQCVGCHAAYRLQ